MSAALRATAGLVLVCAVWGVYWVGLSAPFYYDDWPNIVENYRIHWRELSWGELWQSVASSPSRRPLAIWSFGLSHYLGGLDPFAFRSFNVLLHALVSLLVGWLTHSALSRFVAQGDARRDPRLTLAALAAAGFFALHPLQTQSVTYIVQRMNVLATFFYLLGFVAYLRVRARSVWDAPRIAWGAALLACYVCGIGSKQIAVTLPFALWLFEWFFFQELSRSWARRHLWWWGVPLVVGALVVAVYLGGDLFYGYGAREFTPFERVLTQLRVLWFYLSLIVLPLPSRLTLLHDFEISRSLIAPLTTAIAGAAWVLALWCAWRGAERHRFAAFALLWFLLHSAIESSFLSLMLVFEHRTYLPLVGISMGLGAAVYSAAGARPRAIAALLVVVLGLLGSATVARNQLWAAPEAFWRDALAKGSHPRIHGQLAQIIAYLGRDAEAIPHYERILARDPEFTGGMRGLASCYAALGRYDEAAEWWRAVLEREPQDHPSLAGLGRWHERAGRLGEAWEYNRKALALRPTAELLSAQAAILRREGKPLRGLRYLGTARELDARSAATLVEGVQTLNALGRYRDAVAWVGQGALSGADRVLGADLCAQTGAAALAEGADADAHLAYRQALELDATHLGAANNLAWLLATTADGSLRDPAAARVLAQRAVSLEAAPDAASLDTLAAAHAASGAFEAALEVGERARSLASDVTLQREIDARLMLYRAGRPFVRDAPSRPGEESGG